MTTEFNDLSQSKKFELLNWYYENNGMYNSEAQAAFGVDTWAENMKPLRNPAYRVVEFYVATIWPGDLPKALPIKTDNSKIVAPIQQVWTWSNWAAKKQVASRWFARDGNLFIKVATLTPDPSPALRHPLGQGAGEGSASRVYFQLLEAKYVTDIEADERGYLTYIRIDTPVVEGGKALTRTEVWDKEAQTYTVWVHDKSADTPTEKLGPPRELKGLAEFGIDFIPIVYAKFRDTGQDWGECAFQHALDKIDEANVIASRLHDMLLPGEVWVLKANGTDASGRPLPAPKIGSSTGTGTTEKLEIARRTLFRLPGNSELESLVPNINYDAALNVLNAHMDELEKDLPELAYYRLREMSDLSGRAIRLLLGDAIAKAKEARGTAEAALARADAMALTIGAAVGLDGFSGLGDYAAGDFAHTFAERDIIALSDLDKLVDVILLTDTRMPLLTILREMGWDEERINQLTADKEQEAEQSQALLGTTMAAAQKNFDRGQGA